MENKKPVCPIACKYCMAQKIDSREKEWSSGKRIGMNKTCVFINRLPFDVALSKMDLPWSLLEGDVVGFQGITDCMWEVYREDLFWLIDNIDRMKIKKLLLCTKFVIPTEVIIFIKQKGLVSRIAFIVSVTGLDKLERTTTASRMDSIIQLKREGFDVLPAVHPYIHGVSDLSFFETLSKAGITEITWKGFRYNPQNMVELKKYIPEEILKQYESENEEEILVGEKFIAQQASIHGLSYVDMKAFAKRGDNPYVLSEEKAEELLNQLATQVVFSTSSKKEEVLNYRKAVRCNK